MRSHNRAANQLRPVTITRHYTRHAEGSVLIEFGNTKVLCNASVVTGVPRFLKDSGQGWVTAEYGMLPRATHQRTDREATRGKQSGRTLEIQRLIGRALRTALDLKLLGEHTITLDCDVIQADGGTRTAAITGSWVALADAISVMQTRGLIKQNPIRYAVAAVSVGICARKPLLDLDYNEDAAADTDMNVIMTEQGGFIELQGTAERAAFSSAQLQQLLSLAETGISTLLQQQRAALTVDSE